MRSTLLGSSNLTKLQDNNLWQSTEVFVQSIAGRDTRRHSVQSIAGRDTRWRSDKSIAVHNTRRRSDESIADRDTRRDGLQTHLRLRWSRCLATADEQSEQFRAGLCHPNSMRSQLSPIWRPTVRNIWLKSWRRSHEGIASFSCN
jgi:hypothetical protein